MTGRLGLTDGPFAGKKSCVEDTREGVCGADFTGQPIICAGIAGFEAGL